LRETSKFHRKSIGDTKDIGNIRLGLGIGSIPVIVAVLLFLYSDLILFPFFFIALGVTIASFVAGNWKVGLVALGVSVVLFSVARSVELEELRMLIGTL